MQYDQTAALGVDGRHALSRWLVVAVDDGDPYPAGPVQRDGDMGRRTASVLDAVRDQLGDHQGRALDELVQAPAVERAADQVPGDGGRLRLTGQHP
ncbi:hypothetical protein EF906_23320 [Streptomyces sp. WAC08241]|nr:hypothetical protein [Streptomyces sp. WAC08241]RSS37315.1 hypothetical protein EF906_23320 [Streptomyces sp. WAC08241]